MSKAMLDLTDYLDQHLEYGSMRPEMHKILIRKIEAVERAAIKHGARLKSEEIFGVFDRRLLTREERNAVCQTTDAN